MCIRDSGCTPWWPETVGGVDKFYESGNRVGYSHVFRWNQSTLDALQSIDVSYQWELRRPDTPDVWDYWVPTFPGIPLSGCEGVFWWSDLPEPTDQYSEEYNIIDECPLKCHSLGGVREGDLSGDEEFEVKSEKTEDIQPGENYSVYVMFKRKVENETIEINVNSQFCGDNHPQFCGAWFDNNLTQIIETHNMWKENVTS